MAFTAERLAESLNIGADRAQELIDVIRGDRDPESYDHVARWVAQCYHKPDAIELKIAAADQILETCGTVAIWGSSCVQPVATYCNNGDTYAPTILYDYMAGRWRLTSWGDFVERFERRYQIQ